MALRDNDNAAETRRQREITVQGNPGSPVGDAGRMMLARMNSSHEAVTEWGLEHFRLPSNAALLDIGCGGGATLLRLLRLCPEGHVAGVDHSPVSVDASQAFCREAIEAGRVDVQLASVENLPFADGAFDGACTVESFYFWPDHEANLREVLRVLKPGGTLLVIADTFDDGALDAEALANIEQFSLFVPTVAEMEHLLTRAGFTDVCIHTLADKHWICAEAHVRA